MLVVKIVVYFDKEIMYIKRWTWFLPSLAHQKWMTTKNNQHFIIIQIIFLREISSYTHFRQNNQNDLPILFLYLFKGACLDTIEHVICTNNRGCWHTCCCQHPKHLKKFPISNNWRKKTCNGFFVKSTYGCDIIALSLVCKNFCRLLT